MSLRFAPLILLAALCAPARADAPLPAPEKHVVCANSGRFCATSDPATNTTRVEMRGAKDPGYELPGWHRWMFVSDDGEHVVTGHDGVNLVPLHATLREPVLVFHERGKVVRTLVLGDLYADLSQLTRTVSHRAWSDTVRLQGDRLVVKLVDGRVLAFDVRTGLPARMPGPATR